MTAVREKVIGRRGFGFKLTYHELGFSASTLASLVGPFVVLDMPVVLTPCSRDFPFLVSSSSLNLLTLTMFEIERHDDLVSLQSRIS